MRYSKIKVKPANINCTPALCVKTSKGVIIITTLFSKTAYLTGENSLTLGDSLETKHTN